MSWSVSTAGVPAAVAATVSREAYVPEPVKQCVTELMALCSNSGFVLLETNGHLDTVSVPGWSNVTLTIRTLKEAKQAP